MRPGDRVSLGNRLGTVVGFVPAGMVDVQFDDASWVERKPAASLVAARARRNPSRARRNPSSKDPSPTLVPVGESITASAHAMYLAHLTELRRMLPEAEAELARVPNERARNAAQGSDPERYLWHKSPVDKVDWIRKQIDRTERKLQLRVVPDPPPGASSAPPPDLPSLSPETVKARQREQRTAYSRSAGRALKKQVEADLAAELPKAGAVLLTEPDPPRLSNDRTSYCGNPIDGVAYYIVLQEERRALSRYVTKEEVYRAAQEAGLDPKLLARVVTVKPRPEYQPIYEFLRSFQVGLEKRGTTVEVERAAGRQFVRPRPGMGMSTELAVREKKAGPVGMEADPNIHFSLMDETGGLNYLKVYSSGAAALTNLERFQDYMRRQFVAPETMPLRDAIVAASKRDPVLGPRGIHPIVADMFVRSCAVSVDRVPVEPPDPNMVVKQGARISLVLWDKSKSPFFSWVPAPAIPLSVATRDVEHCLSADDYKVRALLQNTRDALGQFRAGLGSVRSLFARLVEQGTPDAATLGTWIVAALAGTEKRGGKRFGGLAQGYTAMWRWWNRLVERARLNEIPFIRAYQAFAQTVLRPEDETSPFYQGLTQNVRTSEQFAGLLGGEGWNEGGPSEKLKAHRGLVKANLKRQQQKLTRRGYDFEITSEELGTYRYRVPPSRARAEVVDAETASAFLNGLLLLVLSARSPGQVEADDWSGAVSLPRRPGVAALQFLINPDVRPHPYDDLYAYIYGSLRPEAVNHLDALRKQAGDTAIGMMLHQDAPPPPRVKSDSGDASAWQFRRLVGLYATGGVHMRAHHYEGAQGERGPCRICRLGPEAAVHLGASTLDPLDTRFNFELKAPAGWPVSAEEQQDVNWAITLVIDSVYPALLRQRVPHGLARLLCRDLILLALLYDMVQGFNLAGPLNPEGPAGAAAARMAALRHQQRLFELQSKAAHADSVAKRKVYESKLKQELEKPTVERGASEEILSIAQQELGEAEADLLGGSRGLGGTGKYRAYRTYNPVLFELTRLFWPPRRGGDRSGPEEQRVSFGSILSFPDRVFDIDVVGRFGHALQQTQGIAARAHSETEVSGRLEQLLSPVLGQPIKNVMSGYNQAFAPFVLNWPLGEYPTGAAEAARQWVDGALVYDETGAPAGYLKNLKDLAEAAISKVRFTRRKGMHGVKPGQADIPFMYKDRPAIHPSSVVRADRTEEEARVQDVLAELDRAIDALGEP